jgi:ABC-type glycerol-3-phosphate transport system permease component
MRRVARVAIDLAIAAALLFPLYWGLVTSLKPADRILRFPPEFWPSIATLEHYALLFRTGVERFVLNSAIVAVASVALSLAIGSLAAYALARLPLRGKGALLVGVMALMSIPLPSLIVPTFTFLATIGLNDTLTGLVLLYTAYQLPIVVWVLYGYFLSLPVELEQAAMIDGHSRLAVLRRIVLPLSGPGLVAAGLFVLTFAWNDFVVAVAMTSSESVKTLPLAIYGYLGFYGRDWGPLTAAAMLSVVPVIAVFLFFQRYFLSGMTSGGTKS